MFLLSFLEMIIAVFLIGGEIYRVGYSFDLLSGTTVATANLVKLLGFSQDNDYLKVTKKRRHKTWLKII